MNRLVSAVIATSTVIVLGACGPTPPPNSIFPEVDSVSVTPQQVTDTTTPFTITLVARTGKLDPSGLVNAFFPITGNLMVLADDRAEWRPAGSGGKLPAASVVLPLNLLGIKGAYSAQTPAKFVFLQFEPATGGGLAYKGFSTNEPSTSPVASAKP